MKKTPLFVAPIFFLFTAYLLFALGPSSISLSQSEHFQSVLYATSPWLAGLWMMFTLIYAAGCAPLGAAKQILLTSPPDSSHTYPWISWLVLCIWYAGVVAAFVFLPAGFFLKHSWALAFIGLTWLSLDRSNVQEKAIAKRMAWVFVILAALYFAPILSSQFRTERFFNFIAGPLYPESKHYETAQVMRAWSTGIKIVGATFADRPAIGLFESVRLPITGARLGSYGTELVKIALNWGWLLAAAIGSAILLAWAYLFNCLRRTAHSSYAATESGRALRLLTLALVVIHGLATFCWVLFNFAVIRQSFGLALIPSLKFAIWWPLHIALAICLALSWLKFRTHKETENKPLRTHFNAALPYIFAFVLMVPALIWAEEWRRQAHWPQYLGAEVAKRADIKSADGHVLATSILARDVLFTPSDFWSISSENKRPALPGESTLSDTEREARLLQALQAWPQVQQAVQAKLHAWPKNRSSQATLAYGLSEEQVKSINNTQLTGIETTLRYKRHYPEGSLYAHVVGYSKLDASMDGQAGAEFSSNGLLGRFHRDITLTLDHKIQQAAHRALQDGMAEHKAIGGAIAVVDVATGQLLAMSSAPTFNPNDSTTFRVPYQRDVTLNRAIEASFPMQSLMMPLLAAELLDQGKIKPDSVLEMNPKGLQIGKVFVQDMHPFGNLTVEESIAKSSHVASAMLAQQLTLEQLRSLTEKLALTVTPDRTNYFYGAAHSAPEWNEWTSAMRATPGFSIRVNLLQALNAYLPLARDGRMSYIDWAQRSGNTTEAKQAFKAETAQTVRDMLEKTTTNIGNAPKAAVPSIRTFGKTATIWRDITYQNDGTELVHNNASVFIGMATPPEGGTPKYLVGVFLEFGKKPNQMGFAGDTAAPVFASLVSQLLPKKQ